MLFKKNKDIEFEEYNEEYTETEKNTYSNPKERKLKKIINIIFIILVLIMAIIATDVICVSRYNKGPFFAIKTDTYDDGGTKIYYGIGYKVIKYNQVQGRKDTQIGFWNMKYSIEPTTIDAVDLAIEFRNKPEATSKKYYKKFLRLTGEFQSYDKNKQKLTIAYNDSGNKYTLNIICSLDKDNENTSFEKDDSVTIIGTLEQFKLKSDDKPNRAYISNCFAE